MENRVQNVRVLSPRTWPACHEESNVGILIKPRDIKTLELEALQGLGAGAKLQTFFEAAEQCTSDPRC